MRGILLSESGSRQQMRLSISLPAIVTTAQGTRRVLLRDLSLRGARIRSELAFEIGDQVVLQWYRFEALGKVCWIEGDTCGLGFYRSIQLRDLLDTRDLDQSTMCDVERDVVRRTSAAFVAGRVRL